MSFDFMEDDRRRLLLGCNAIISILRVSKGSGYVERKSHTQLLKNPMALQFVWCFLCPIEVHTVLQPQISFGKKKKNERKICLISGKLQTTKSSKFSEDLASQKPFSAKILLLGGGQQQQRQRCCIANVITKNSQGFLHGTAMAWKFLLGNPRRIGSPNLFIPIYPSEKSTWLYPLLRWPLSFNSDLVSHTYSMMIRVPPHPCPLSNFRGFAMRIAIYLLLPTHSRW